MPAIRILRGCLLGTVLLLSALVSAAGYCQEKIVITKSLGETSVLRHGKSMPANSGMECAEGDVLLTKENCVLDIAMNDMAGARLLASSQCVIEGAQAKSMHLKITEGNAILNLEKLPENSTFRVETPTAVASVRGTQFWGRVDRQNEDDPVTTFAVREGAVVVYAKSAGQSFEITPGQALDIPVSDESAPAVRSALPEELEAMEQADSILTSSG